MLYRNSKLWNYEIVGHHISLILFYKSLRELRSQIILKNEELIVSILRGLISIKSPTWNSPRMLSLRNEWNAQKDTSLVQQFYSNNFISLVENHSFLLQTFLHIIRAWPSIQFARTNLPPSRVNIRNVCITYSTEIDFPWSIFS